MNTVANNAYLVRRAKPLFNTVRPMNNLPVLTRLSFYVGAPLLFYKGKDYSQELTIKHLLSHTSGLPDYFQGNGKSGKSLENEITEGIKTETCYSFSDLC